MKSPILQSVVSIKNIESVEYWIKQGKAIVCSMIVSAIEYLISSSNIGLIELRLQSLWKDSLLIVLNKTTKSNIVEKHQKFLIDETKGAVDKLEKCLLNIAKKVPKIIAKDNYEKFSFNLTRQIRHDETSILLDEIERMNFSAAEVFSSVELAKIFCESKATPKTRERGRKPRNRSISAPKLHFTSSSPFFRPKLNSEMKVVENFVTLQQTHIENLSFFISTYLQDLPSWTSLHDKKNVDLLVDLNQHMKRIVKLHQTLVNDLRSDISNYVRVLAKFPQVLGCYWEYGEFLSQNIDNLLAFSENPLFLALQQFLARKSRVPLSFCKICVNPLTVVFPETIKAISVLLKNVKYKDVLLSLQKTYQILSKYITINELQMLQVKEWLLPPPKVENGMRLLQTHKVIWVVITTSSIERSQVFLFFFNNWTIVCGRIQKMEKNEVYKVMFQATKDEYKIEDVPDNIALRNAFNVVIDSTRYTIQSPKKKELVQVLSRTNLK